MWCGGGVRQLGAAAEGRGERCRAFLLLAKPSTQNIELVKKTVAGEKQRNSIHKAIGNTLAQLLTRGSSHWAT
jgi:hypothetical protein